MEEKYLIVQALREHVNELREIASKTRGILEKRIIYSIIHETEQEIKSLGF